MNGTSVLTGTDNSINKGNRKYFLDHINGFALPKQMMAIMGPSGSGKTSLLNYLAQRFQALEDVKYSGDVRCNNRIVEKQDFGKIGAYI